MLFQGGLRRSEAAALRWADVQDAADGRYPLTACVAETDIVPPLRGGRRSRAGLAVRTLGERSQSAAQLLMVRASLKPDTCLLSAL